jgi:hypothetical protein
MKSTGQTHHQVLESRTSNISNALNAQALHEFLCVSNPSDNLLAERIFLDAPRWHTACKCRCNGTKHETSRTLLFGLYPVSLASRAASRRVVPGLWRTGRISSVTAPSLKYYCDSRTVYCLRSAGRPTNIHRDGRQYGKHCRELERERNSRRECNSRNDRCGRRLHRSGKSPIARFGVRAGSQRGRLYQKFDCARNDC